MDGGLTVKCARETEGPEPQDEEPWPLDFVGAWPASLQFAILALENVPVWSGMAH